MEAPKIIGSIVLAGFEGFDRRRFGNLETTPRNHVRIL